MSEELSAAENSQNRKKLSILHVCCASNDQSNGMNRVIPEHVKAQNQIAEAKLLNLTDYPQICDSSIVDKNCFDLVIFHGVYIPEIIRFWRKHIKNRIPYIVIPHGSMTHRTQEKGRLKKMVFNFGFAYPFTRNAVAVQFLSAGERDNSSKTFYQRCFVEPNGIEPAKKRFDADKREKTDGIKLLYIGRYDKYYKGLDIMLEACNRKKDYMREHHVEITLFGRYVNSDIEWIKEFIEKNHLKDIVSVHNSIYGDEKEKELLNCDFFIQTSRSEGLPMGILEAFSYGIPVLITKETNLAEDVKKYQNGCVTEAAVEGVESLFRFAVKNKGNLRDLSAASLRAAKQYEWNTVAQKTISKYEELLDIH